MAPDRRMRRAGLRLMWCGLWLGVACGAAAGPLGDLRWPHAGRPAVATPGGRIDVGLSGGGTLAIQHGDRALPLALARDGGPPGARYATVPEALAPGVYDLVYSTPAGREEERPAVLHILESHPETYSFAVVSGTLLDGGDPEAVARVARRLKEVDAGLAFLMGPLLESGGGAEAWDALREAITALAVPVFVCPAARDVADPDYEAYFGTPVYAAAYGADGYLMLGPGLRAYDPAVPGLLGVAYQGRRRLRASRWSTGVTARYGLDWHPRAQMVLFADDPLDYVVAGALPADAGDTVPWGRAHFVPPPALPRGAFLVLDVSGTGIRVRPPAPAAD